MTGLQRMGLLEALPEKGYPTEYLLSRLKGRRARLVSDWRQIAEDPAMLEPFGTPETVRGALLREYRWVYGQMDRTLREALDPFFLYAEIGTLCIGLRHAGERRAEGPAARYSESLLGPAVKDAMLMAERREDAVQRTGVVLASLSPGLAGLGSVLERGGLRAVEQRLVADLLAALLERRLHPGIRDLFRGIIDSRNILALSKTLREGDGTRPSFLPGGRLPLERLDGMLAKNDPSVVLALVREAAGSAPDSLDISAVETALYRGITRDLRAAGRDPLGIGVVLQYLWRCSLQAMNLSMLMQGKILDRGTVMAELVHG